MASKIWKKFGTCKVCGKRKPLKVPNVLPLHHVNCMPCPGSNLPGLDHAYEKIKGVS